MALFWEKSVGTAVDSAEVRLCHDVLLVKQVIHSYGLTESGFITRPFQPSAASKAYDVLPLWSHGSR